MSAVADARPVIIGVGDLRHNRERDPAAAREPLALIRQAAEAAAHDAGLDATALTGLDAVGVVQIVSWSYDDAAAALADAVGAQPTTAFVSDAGGHQPVAVLARLAGEIAAGRSTLALLCGGEAQSSLEVLGAAKDPDAAPAWSHDPGGAGRFSRAVGGTEPMWDLGLVGPIRVYPLFENRLRHELGQSFAESQDASARLYARFSEVAADNPAAWYPETRTPEEIATVGERNRMICFPYPLYMNAVNRVDQAAAVLLASAGEADRLGVPEDRRVYVRATAVDEDCEDVLRRPHYGRGPGLERSLDAALGAAGLTPDGLDVVDLYSCFPVVPKLAARHLALDADADLSAVGGLRSFGGPHNDYSSHALAAVTRRLRDDDGASTGLVYANGEYLTKHATCVLSTAPGPFTAVDPTPDPEPLVDVDADYTGEAVLETFTVEFDREGARARGFAIVRTPAGTRCGLRVSKSDAATLDALVSPDDDPIGRAGHVVGADGRRQFTFGE